MPENRPRIAVDISCLNPQPLTGVGYYTRELLGAFARTQPGFALRLYASGARGPSAPVVTLGEQCGGVSFQRLPTFLKTRLWTTVERPRMDRRTGAVDLAHGGFHLVPAARGVPRLVTVFDLTGLRLAATHTAASQRIHRRYLEHAARRADGFIAISGSCRDDVVELLGVDPARVRLVHGGVDPAPFAGVLDPAALAEVKARHGIRGEYLVHLGTIEPRKNLPRLLEAYARVRRANPGTPSLVLAGKRGWLCGAVFEAIDRLDLEDAVVETGYLSREDAVTLLRGAVGCTYPSLYEGFGLPVLEAMAAGVPVLTSNVSSLPEVAGEAAVYVAPESVESIAEGLETLMGDTAGREARVAAGLARAECFTWEASAAALADAYRSFL